MLAQLLDEAEARQLPALIEAWEGADDARTWIARALRIDLALSIERPELVLPALHRRLVRFGDDDQFFTRITPPRHALEASALVASWIAAWGPGRRWLRSLIPPPVALDAGVVAEYRSDVQGPVSFSSNGARIGVGDVVWERATGRRLDAPSIAEVPERVDCELERCGDGKLVLAARGRTIELAIDEDAEARDAHALSPEVALVGGICGDGALWWLVDLVRGRLIADGYGVPMASAAVGQLSYVAVRDVIHAFDRDGELGAWNCPKASSLVACPEGFLATRTGHVIRVWDPIEAVAAGVRRRHEPTPATTLWSVDGDQLVSCGRLLDATTGDVIADLRVADWSGALEGGPSARYQGFTEVGFVEVSHHGLRGWDREGQLVVDDRARNAWGSTSVAIDPTGRRFARFRGRLEVTTLRDGHEVLTENVDLERDPRLGFTATGDLWWEAKTGERWMLAADSSVPHRTTDDAPVDSRGPKIEPRDGLLVVGDVALPLDEPVRQGPHMPWYAGRSTLIHLVEPG